MRQACTKNQISRSTQTVFSWCKMKLELGKLLCFRRLMQGWSHPSSQKTREHSLSQPAEFRLGEQTGGSSRVQLRLLSNGLDTRHIQDRKNRRKMSTVISLA